MSLKTAYGIGSANINAPFLLAMNNAYALQFSHGERSH
jgi:hypothetical protein